MDRMHHSDCRGKDDVENEKKSKMMIGPGEEGRGKREEEGRGKRAFRK